MTETREFGQRPELTWLPIDRLSVSDKYQRSLDTPTSKRMIGKIADNFKWSAFQAILATPQGPERWLIIDGQHRVAAARQVGLSMVPGVVIHEATETEQAQAFVRANRDRVPMSSQALYHARVLAGDADALTIARICREAGIEITRHNVSAVRVPARKTAGVAALFRMLKVYGEETTAIAIKAVAEAYGNEPGTLRSPFFLAAAQFLHTEKTENGLRLALEKVGWRNLEAAAYGLAGGTGIAELVGKLKAALKTPASPPPFKAGALSAAPPTPKPAHASSPTSPPMPAPKPEPAIAGRFTDDPRARGDHGSRDGLPLTGPFGRSATGSSLA